MNSFSPASLTPANISANFCKNSNWPQQDTQGPGETDSWKKPEVENLVSGYLSGLLVYFWHFHPYVRFFPSFQHTETHNDILGSLIFWWLALINPSGGCIPEMRVHIDWRWPLSRVRSVIFSVQLAEGTVIASPLSLYPPPPPTLPTWVTPPCPPPPEQD